MSAFPGNRYPIAWGMNAQYRQVDLNLCPIERWLWRSNLQGTPARAFWRAKLKARQLQLLLYRIQRDKRRCREQGWLDPDPDTGEISTLFIEIERRFFAAMDRLRGAQARADRMRRLMPKRPSLGDIARSFSPPQTT